MYPKSPNPLKSSIKARQVHNDLMAESTQLETAPDDDIDMNLATQITKDLSELKLEELVFLFGCGCLSTSLALSLPLYIYIYIYLCLSLSRSLSLPPRMLIY